MQVLRDKIEGLQQPPTSFTIEQAIVNLSKVVGKYVEEQKGINVQLA